MLKSDTFSTEKPLIPACTERHYTVTRLNLPLCCPMPDRVLWNAHPRVYLPIEQLKKVTCPYCDTVYELVDAESIR